MSLYMESPRESESSKDRGRYKSCGKKEKNVNSHNQFPLLVMHKEIVKWSSSAQLRGQCGILMHWLLDSYPVRSRQKSRQVTCTVEQVHLGTKRKTAV